MKSAIWAVLSLMAACNGGNGGDDEAGGGMSNGGGGMSNGGLAGAAGSFASGGVATSGGTVSAGGASGGQVSAGSTTGGAGSASGGAGGGGGVEPCREDDAASGAAGIGEGGASHAPVGRVHDCLGQACPRGECSAPFGGCSDLYCGSLDPSFAYCTASSGSYCLVTLSTNLDYWVIDCTGGEPTFTPCDNGCGVAGDVASCNL